MKMVHKLLSRKICYTDMTKRRKRRWKKGDRRGKGNNIKNIYIVIKYKE